MTIWKSKFIVDTSQHGSIKSTNQSNYATFHTTRSEGPSSLIDQSHQLHKNPKRILHDIKHTWFRRLAIHIESNRIVLKDNPFFNHKINWSPKSHYSSVLSDINSRTLSSIWVIFKLKPIPPWRFPPLPIFLIIVLDNLQILGSFKMLQTQSQVWTNAQTYKNICGCVCVCV